MRRFLPHPTSPWKATVYTQVWIKAKTLEIPLNPPWKGGLRPDLSPLLGALHCRGTRTVRASAF
jgi:hypothetical protein